MHITNNMEQNIILTSMPWGWKTTLWKNVSREIWYNFIDYDDDVLEKITYETSEEIIWILKLKSEGIITENIAFTEVKNLVKVLWDGNFLKLEWFIWERLNFPYPTVLSTSWSLPLSTNTMDHLRENWKVIYLDTDIKAIMNRLEKMKTDRIVWIWNMTLEEILKYRKEFYDKSKDYNFDVPRFDLNIKDSKEESKRQKKIIFEEFMKYLIKNNLWNQNI